MISAFLSRVISLGLGTLYPAYASYKAVRTKNVKEYVKWMMYWIVFAIFTSLETFTDFFLAFWFPFYYEIKIVMLIWLLSPATKGSSLLYRKFVHPALVRREQKIDQMMEAAQTQSYNTAVELVHRGARYLTNMVMEGALRAPGMMAQIVQTGTVAGQLVALDQPDRRGNQVMPPPTPGMAVADFDMSDDELVGGFVQQSTPLPPLAQEMEEGSGEEEGRFEDLEQTEAPASKVNRRKKKPAAADLSFSSGGEEDPDFEPPSSSNGDKKTKASGVTRKGNTRKSTRKPKQ